MAGRRKLEEDRAQARRIVALMVLLALWIAASGVSLALLLRPAELPLPGAPWPGRLTGFLGWQGVAGILAIGCWGLGRAFPCRSGIRRVAAVPLLLAAGVLAVLLGAALAGIRGG